jgi:hypothetical protein
MNHMMIVTVMVTFLSAMLIAIMVSLPVSFSQEQSNNSNTNNTVVTKTSSNSYIIMDNGFELVGAFDTVYTITGSSDSINKSKDSVISIIQDDFDNTPSIGYIRVANVTDVLGAVSNQTGAEIQNPFVDMQTINSTIITELSDSINSASGFNLTTVTIKCDFGMNVKDWKCEDHGIM